MDPQGILNLISTTAISICEDCLSDKSAYLWVVILGFIVAFVLAFGVGANDVANCFGTSVGSGVISLRNACLVATVFEMAGAILIGHKVSDTIRKGIVDLAEYQNSPEEYMLGNLSALGGSAIWLLVATFLKMPISGTHSIVGSVLGFSLVARGFQGINWATLGKIVGSWFISPVLSGLVSGAIFYIINRFILQKPDPIRPGLVSLPIFYGITIFINIISIMLDGPEVLKINVGSLPKWTESAFGALISIGISLIIATVVAVWFVPRLRKQIRAILDSISAKPDAKKTSTIFTIGLNASSPNDDITLKNSNTNFVDNDKAIAFDKSSRDSPSPQLKLSVDSNLVNYKNEMNHNNTISDDLIMKKYLKQPEIIPMDGITPNGSNVPLIKQSDGQNVSELPLNYDVDFGEGGITFGPDSSTESTKTEDVPDDRPGVGKLFSFLQIMTAAFGSFAHGGNDVSNAIGPLIALYLVYKESRIESQAQTPIWLLIFGGVGISIGLWVWGRRVIKTMGEDLTKITPSSGFTIEIGAAMTVLVASKIGIPVSTTHCKVGSVVFVGWVRTKGGGVDWALFRNIIFAWLVTLPISAGLSALLMWILSSFML